MNDSTKRRAWVKNAIIIFLVIMLILTFFSNTIMNHSLPEVAAQYARSGSITSKIRLSAAAKANSTYEIKIDETRTVKAVAVKEGDEVQIGDVLFYLEDEESTELQNARKALEDLEKQYQLRLLVLDKDYYADNLAITNKRDEIAKAEKNIPDLGKYSTEIAALGTKIAGVQTEIAGIETAIATLRTGITALEAQIDADDVSKDEIKAQKKQIAAELKQIARKITEHQEMIARIKPEAADSSLTGELTADRLAAAEAVYSAAESEFKMADNKKNITAVALNKAEKAFDTATEKWEDLGVEGDTDAESIAEQIAELTKTMRRAKEDFQRSKEKLEAELEKVYDEWVDADWRYYLALSNYNNGRGDYSVVEQRRAEAEAKEEAYNAMREQINPQIKDLEFTYNRTKEDNDEKLAKLEALAANVEGYQQIKEALDIATEELETAKKKSETAIAAYDEAKTALETASADRKALQMLELLESWQNAMEALELQTDALNDKDAALDENTAELTEHQGDLNSEIAKLESEIVKKEADISVKESEITRLEQEIKAVEESIPELDDHYDAIDKLKQELATLQHNLAQKQKEDRLAGEKEQMEIDELLEDIAEQQALIEKYQANSTDAKILATIAGRISGITVAQGSETSIGQTMCEIIVTELGYSCEISLSAEQARRVRVGDAVEVTNNWWSNLKGTLVSLRNDPKNPGGSKIGVIALEGDVSDGQSLNLTIGEKGQTYDTVVPNSAVREDNNGKFVLVVEAKSSPLGNRYIARRYDIEVLASDDTNSAVSGLYGSEFIITTSQSPITSGNQVRLTEN